MTEQIFLPDKGRPEWLEILMRHAGMYMFTYRPGADELTVYDHRLEIVEKIKGVLRETYRRSLVHPEDFWKMQELLEGRLQGPLEIRIKKEAGGEYQKMSMDAREEEIEGIRLGSIKNVTRERQKEEIWQEQARRDSLTGLYNNMTGKILITEYLTGKSPLESCGMMVLDVDYFKNINDNYGHLFGDEVLTVFAGFLKNFFAPKDIVIRAGGDEFVILLKGISQASLVKKAIRLVDMIRKIRFSQSAFSITCSVGVCYLPENVSGFTYDQLFENADWALYKAKINGRNCYVFCDSLKRFEMSSQNVDDENEIDTRYLRNDAVATAFEIFEKQNSFDAAIQLLLKVIGIRFQLDRITVIQTDVRYTSSQKKYQWFRKNIPEVLETAENFSREDFQTLFRSYDEYGTTVLQHNNMEMYSPAGRKLLMQGGARTVLYAAMYCEGRYTGAISFVVCSNTRYWSKSDRKQLGELTKIISVHMAKRQAINANAGGNFATPGYDTLTGLISFQRFKEEAERIIVSGYATEYLMMYTDFIGFKYFNQKYGYTAGDQVLKEFANELMERMPDGVEGYFTRVMADQFLLFMPYKSDEVEEIVAGINDSFCQKINGRYPEARMMIRTGVYRVAKDCPGASTAIDAANYARKQIAATGERSVLLFDETVRKQQELENAIIGRMDEAMQKGEFQVFYQPKILLATRQIIGAEALVRWIRPDGTILTPYAFVPLYEKNGRIIELDYYVMEKVAQMLQKNIVQHRPVVPVSVNISALHAAKEDTKQRYMEILLKYGLTPELFQVEITESATVFNYENVREMFGSFRNAGFTTALDDFGAGLSVMNLIADIPLDVVKLDRIFIDKCETSQRGKFFLGQIVQLLKGLGFTVLCEGVETKAQELLLSLAGCDQMQGNGFSKPLPEEEFCRLLEKRL